MRPVPYPSSNGPLKMKNSKIETGAFDVSSVEEKCGWTLSGGSSMCPTIFWEQSGLLRGLGLPRSASSKLLWYEVTSWSQDRRTNAHHGRAFGNGDVHIF